MRTIAHISDIHFGRIDPPVVQGLVRDLNLWRPTLVVVSGDLTQRARRGQFAQASEFLRRLPQPQLVIPGNHDVPLWNVFSRFLNPLGNFRRLLSDNLMPVYSDDEIFVIGLNTARSLSPRLRGFWKDGRISARQLGELRRRLESAPTSATRIVVTHHPFIPAPGEDPHDIVHGAKRALPVLEALEVDLLLAGHLHLSYRDDVRSHHLACRRSILSVQAGSATSTRRRGQPNSYNWITVESGCLQIDVRSWSGEDFARIETWRFERQAGEWKNSP